jgi:hypothetical protein
MFLIDSPLGNEKNRLEFKLTFDGEVLNREMILPVIGQALVESGVFLRCDVGGISRPDGLGLVEFLIRHLLFFDLFCLLVLWLVFFVVDLLYLGLFLVILLFFVIFHFLLCRQ